MPSEPIAADPIITAAGLGKRFPIFRSPLRRLGHALLRGWVEPHDYYQALRDITFDMPRRSTVGIIGRNGAGKSTLLQIVAGVLKPSTGRLEVRSRVAALLELGAGLNFEFTGRENAYLLGALYGLSDAKIDAKIESMAAFADIDAFFDMPVKTYSSGMVVRLAFAVMAHLDAEILIIDEALAVGDALFGQKCMRYLRQFKERGTILFVSHDMGAVTSLCDHVLWLDHGTLMMQGHPKEVTEAYLESLYGNLQGDVKTQARRNSAAPAAQNRVVYRDMRQDVINHSTLRNDIEITQFREQVSSFGSRGGEIRRVALENADGEALAWAVGGELVRLRVVFECIHPIDGAIVGFFVKNQLGQEIFGDNTCLTSLDAPVDYLAGDSGEAIFEFQMPILKSGSYTLTVALAAGTQDNHVQHDWIHDALVFSSYSGAIANGLVGIPMKEIRLGQVEK